MRGLGNVFKGAVFLAGLLGLSAAAFAQADPRISGYLSPLPAEVTLSRPATKQDEALTTYAGYQLYVTNKSTNTLNRVYITATATNSGGTDPVVWDSSSLDPDASSGLPMPCTGYGTSTIRCESTVSLAPGEENKPAFIIVARAPKNGTYITVQWSAGGHEGNGGGNGCCAFTGQMVQTGLIDPALVTEFDYLTKATSYVRKVGGSLFTGDRYVSTSLDKFTSYVSAPPGLNVDYTIGNIQENSITVTECATGQLLTCYSSAISLPGVNFETGPGTYSNFLTIKIRIDGSNIKRGTSIEQIRIRYDGAPLNAICGMQTPEIYPCISERKHYKNKSVSGWTRELDNDFEWTIWNFKNGLLEFF